MRLPPPGRKAPEPLGHGQQAFGQKRAGRVHGGDPRQGASGSLAVEAAGIVEVTPGVKKSQLADQVRDVGRGEQHLVAPVPGEERSCSSDSGSPMLMSRDHTCSRQKALRPAHLLVGVGDESEQRLHIEPLDGDVIVPLDQCQVVPLVSLGPFRAEIRDPRDRRAERAIAIERQCLAENRG